MLKRGLFFFLLIAVLSLSAGTVFAQAPFVSITSPTAGAVVDIGAVLNVSVNFGNAPEGGSSLLLRAFNDSESAVWAQNATIDVSLIPWNTTLDFLGSGVPAGSTGHLTAFMLDSGGNIIATSPQINVTYGSAPAPTATATATATTPAPTATATNPGPQPGITVTTPVSGATVDPSTNIPVSGTTSNLPVGATVLVRLRNANGETLGEQGIVPVDGQPWNLTVIKTTSVATTGNGSLLAFLILNGNVVAQTNAIPLTFTGAPPQIAVTITSPANGTTLSRNSPNAITGTTANLIGGATVLVQAFVNGSNSPVGQQTATLNGTSWTASLTLNTPVSAGTPGTIRAFAMDGNTVLASSNVVNVTYGTPTGAPFVQITVPPQNSVVAVNGAPIQLFGLAGNLPQNNIVVRALDTFGNVLAQVNSNHDGQGNWSALLNLSAPAGTPGTLYAFVTNPQGGAIVASSRVNVFYGGQCFVRNDWPVYVVQVGDTLLRIAQRVGSTVTELAYANCIPNANLVYVGQQIRVPRLPVTPQPSQSTLRIIAPVQNAVLDTSERVSVTGAGRNLAGNDVVVRALDANGNLLAQQTTRVGPAGSSGESQWQVSLSLLSSNSARGTIYAFAQVPGSSNILADALIDVSFSSDVIVVPTPAPGDTEGLVITLPSANASVTPNGELQVVGLINGEYEGDLWVLALDNEGNLIHQMEATVGDANAQQQANWEAVLSINVQPGTLGMIYAYISAPFGNEPVLADAVNVVFGELPPGAYVTLSNPLPFSIVDASSPLLIEGRGGRLFEGNVVVRAEDAEGNVLAEAATIIDSPEAGTGGEGNWQISLPVNVPVGTRGSITAYSTSAQDGSVIASATIHVTYGDPTTQPNYVRINSPLANATVDPSEPVLLAGTADDTNVSSVTVQILDEQGNVLVEQPRNLNASANGDYGVWQMLIDLSSMAPGTVLQVNAVSSAGGSDSIHFVVGIASEEASG